LFYYSGNANLYPRKCHFTTCWKSAG